MNKDNVDQSFTEQDEQFRLLVENARDHAIFMVDPEGQIASWNTGAERIFGYEEAEVVGQTFELVFTPEDRERGIPEQELKRAVAEKRAEDTRWMFRKDGERFWADGALTALFNDEGTLQGYGKILRDATERKQAEEERAGIQTALRHQEERYRSLVEATAQIVWTNSPEGEMRGPQPEWGSFTGQSEAEYQGYGWAAAVHPEDASATIEAWEEAVAARSQFLFEHRVRRRDGVYRVFSIRAVPVLEKEGAIREWVGIHTDITDQKEAEQQLAAIHAKNQKIAETLQRSMLLKVPKDTFPGLEVETIYETAWDEALVGGDFFDTFALDDGKVALVVGDFSGKGLAAASHTAEIKYALRAFLREYPSPSQTLTRLNGFLYDTQLLDKRGFDGFVAMTLAVVDTKNRRAEFSVAGMEPPVILHADGTENTVDAEGRFLGIAVPTEFEAVSVLLRPGDLILMATDGILEARHSGEFFGLEGMIQAAREAMKIETDLEQIGRQIMNEAALFGGGSLRDDACLLLAGYRPEETFSGDDSESVSASDASS